MTWHLAPALAQLRAEVNAAWPARDRTSDGTIGDAAHASRVSAHNPDSDGSVNAADVDVDGIDLGALIATALSDGRTALVISNGRYWRPTSGGWRTYTGTNRHDKHAHIEVWHDARENDRTPWGIATRTNNPGATTGDIPDVPDLNSPTPITGGFLMTLNDEQQSQVLNNTNWIVNQMLVPGQGYSWLRPMNDKLDALAPLAQETRDRVRGDSPTGDMLQILTAQVAALLAAVGALALGSGVDPGAITAAAEAGARKALAGLTLTAHA